MAKACTQIYYIICGDVETLKRRHSEWDRIWIVQNGILHELNYSDDCQPCTFLFFKLFSKMFFQELTNSWYITNSLKWGGDGSMGGIITKLLFPNGWGWD